MQAMSPIEKLLGIAKPSGHLSRQISDADWLRVEGQLNLTLPEDYKALTESFGVGIWLEFLVNFSPFSKNRYTNQITLVNEQHLYQVEEPVPPEIDPVFLNAWSKVRADVHKRKRQCPFPFYPSQGGLFPWAQSEDYGVNVHWLTLGFPESWPVVVETFNSISCLYKVYSMPSCEFLVGWLTGTKIPEGFPQPSADLTVFRDYHHV